MLKSLIKYHYLWFFLIAGNGLAVFLIDADHSKAWLVLMAVGFILLSFLAERILPYQTSFNTDMNDSLRDWIHAIVNETLSIVGILMVPFLVSHYSAWDVWPSDWPLWLQLLLAIVMADIGITLMHFASHKITFLWKLHAVHHSVQRMYGFNGLMKHPLHQLIESMAGTAPLLLIGVTPEVMSLLAFAVALQLMLQHSNVDYAVGPLIHLLAINKLHRFHHINEAGEGDVNFGLFTTLTDRVLGTNVYDGQRLFNSIDLGIAKEPHFPNSYLAQLLSPFRVSRREG
ncbi:MAG: sterol desaturase family protein [Pseudomonadales bacterium]|nr:sterol desaturase family protein [Pseudomonadales bacterium]